MDHEVVARPSELCGWLSNSSWDHFDLHQGKNNRMTMEDIMSWGLHYPPTWSNGFCGRRGKRGALLEKGQGFMAKKCCYNKFSNEIYLGKEKVKTREDERMRQTFFFWVEVVLFGHILKKMAHSLFGARSLLMVHIGLTPSEGPKDFVKLFFKKSYHGRWTIKSDGRKRSLSLVQLYGPHLWSGRTDG